uniref:G protein-coupled receptor 137C n=1 Tax=Ornithorhynchus anatinus TaxID=9258 RepID=A0A6I8N525_ORNAN
IKMHSWYLEICEFKITFFPQPRTVVILLYSSRACYNLVITISQDNTESPFNYGWDNLSDKARVADLSGEEYVVFGMVLFLWEFVPTCTVVLFFRAQRPNQNLAPAGMVNSHSYSSRAYFFDNPRRYDSDDDLPRLGGSREGRFCLRLPQYLAHCKCLININMTVTSEDFLTLSGGKNCSLLPRSQGEFATLLSD